MTQTGKLTSSVEQNNDLIGSSVAISGDYIIVGAPGDGTNTGIAYVFEKPGGGWGDATEDASLESSDAAKNEYFGTSVAISSGHAVVGCPIIDTTKGAAYVFEKPGGGWSDASEDQKLSGADSAAGDEFGNAVDISGDYFISGAHDDSNSEGSAYIFYNSTSSVPEFSPYIYITTIFFGLMLIYIFRPKTA